MRCISLFFLCAFMAVSIPCQAEEDASVALEARQLFAIIDVLDINDEGFLQMKYSNNYDYEKPSVCHHLGHGSARRYARHSGNYTANFGTAAISCSTTSYDDLWFSFISQYDLLAETVRLLMSQFSDIAERLDSLYADRAMLQKKYEKYNREGYLDPIDEDIRYLSLQGKELQSVARRFFDAVKPRLIDAEIEKDVLEARTEGMRGLTTFERELQGVTSLPGKAINQSLEQIVAAVDQAVRQLEQAIAE